MDVQREGSALGDLLFLTMSRKSLTRILAHYFRIREGKNDRVARAEAKRIVSLLSDALEFEKDSKKIGREAKRAIGDPEGKRQKQLLDLSDRLERLYTRYSGYPIDAAWSRRGSPPPSPSGLTRGQRRWFTELRSYIREAADMVHGPSPKAIARIQAQIDRLELHLREHSEGREGETR